MATTLMPEARQKYWLADGVTPNAGGLIYPFAAGTSTPKATYTDSAGLVPHAHPIELDSNGEAVIFWNGSYKVNSKTNLDVQIAGWPVDNFNTDPSGIGTLETRLALPTGAGLVGFTVASIFGVDTVGKWLQNLTLSGGSTFIGFIASGVGAIFRTLQAKLRDQVHVSDFGALGTADDAAIWQLAIDSGHRTIDARGVSSTILTQVNLASNQTILFNGASITTGGTSLKTFSAVSKTKFNLVGPLFLTGDLVTNPGLLVTSCGVYVEDCSKFRVTDLTILNVKGYGARYAPGASASARADHGYFSNLRIDGCVWGWKDSPGSGAEYCTVNNIHVTGCADAGIETAAGNILWKGGHCVDNLLDGFRLMGGSNNAHGIVSGMNINHNVQYNVFAENVTNGQTFADCHIYANGSAGQGASYLKNCKGIVFDGGNFDGWLYNDSGANSGLNYMLRMYCPGDYGDVKLLSTNLATKELVAIGNFGAGAYTAGVTINTCSSVSVSVERAAAATQSLTTATPTDLDFPTTVTDRREIFSAQSIVTVPEAGEYSIGGVQYFSATTLDPAASKIVVFVNATAYAEHYPSALASTDKLSFNHETKKIVLAAGDALKLVATITGTGTVLHGHATLRCSMFVERTA